MQGKREESMRRGREELDSAEHRNDTMFWSTGLEVEWYIVRS